MRTFLRKPASKKLLAMVPIVVLTFGLSGCTTPYTGGFSAPLVFNFGGDHNHFDVRSSARAKSKTRGASVRTAVSTRCRKGDEICDLIRKTDERDD